MTNPAHFFGGYLALSVTKKYWLLDGLQAGSEKWLIIYGLVLSLAIDLDVLLAGGITNHHKYATHFPAFWLAVCAGIFLTGITLQNNMIKALAIVTLIASWTHLMLDLVGVTMGIHLFAPFSVKEFSITPLKTDFVTEQARIQYILRSPVVWTGDSLVIIGGIIKMLIDYKK